MRSSILLLLASIAIGVSCMKELEHMRDIARVCMEENGSKFDILRSFRLKHLNPEDIYDNDKCGMDCFLVRSGIFNYHNVINHTRVDYLFDELERKDEMIESLKHCEEDITVMAKCERAFEIILCVRDYLEWDD